MVSKTHLPYFLLGYTHKKMFVCFLINNEKQKCQASRFTYIIFYFPCVVSNVLS